MFNFWVYSAAFVKSVLWDIQRIHIFALSQFPESWAGAEMWTVWLAPGDWFEKYWYSASAEEVKVMLRFP